MHDVTNVEQFTPIYDEPRKWADNFSWKRPSFNVSEFQKKIDDIVGVNRDGRSIVVLRWMRDRECYEKFYTQWDTFGTPIAHELRARYIFVTVDLPNGDIVDIPPPRWVLEQRYEAEQLADAWESARWDMRDGRPVPLRDPFPREGYFHHLWTIARHNVHCCDKDGLTRQGNICWGRYREPSEKDLTVLKAMMWRRAQDDLQTNPYAPLSEKTKETVLKYAADLEAARQQQASELTKEIFADAMNQVKHRYTDDPSVLYHGKYRFVPSNYESPKKKKQRRKKQ